MILLDSARETLVLLGIVVLEADLEFHSLVELALLLGRLGQNSVDSFVKSVTRNLGPVDANKCLIKTKTIFNKPSTKQKNYNKR